MKLRPFSIVPLEKENDLNKILRAQKKTGKTVNLLYTSLWDKASQKLLKKLIKKWGFTGENVEGALPLYIVNSFTMPHSFVIFKTTAIPHLVSIERNVVTSEDYLPRIYHKLCVE